MRGIDEPVRVCDSCFGALMASARGVSAPTPHSGRVFDPSASETSGRLQSREATGAPVAHSTGDSQGNDCVDSSTADDTAAVAVTTPSQQTDATGAVAADAPESTDPQATDVEEHVDNAYQDAYDAGSSQPQQPTLRLSSNVSLEQLEREILARQWSTVRQEAQFVDILVQRAEKVEPTSMVEYSRETEGVMLQPEVPIEVFRETVLPLPLPVENSARYLMEPVKLWTRNNSKQLFTLDSVAQRIAFKLQPPIPQEAIRRVSPSQFAEA